MVFRRAIAFDIGDKRIGVAVSDPFNEYAIPAETYFRTRSFGADVAAIARIARELSSQFTFVKEGDERT